jgi:hypothetical protein
LTDVYAVITYYLWHRQEVDAYLAERRGKEEEVKRENESRFPPRRSAGAVARPPSGEAMIRLVVEEDFDNDILRGVLRRAPDVYIVCFWT